ncbi:MAG: glycosyltransferase [Spirochaetia bacterium]|nr:glycosyltransferase [Spirochaetia bacterium]MCF7941082.1 glycosyltransferase [Spirochaetia bacterium]
MHTELEIFQEVFPDYRELDVTFAHYWLVTWRGGEKVLKALLDLFPRAAVYTMFYDQEVCGPHLEGHPVFSSRYDHRILRRHYQKLFPLYPRAVGSLGPVPSGDLLISSESGPIKGIARADINMPHLCYIHTPMRYCWGGTDDYLNTLPAVARPLARTMFERLRVYDTTTIDNVSEYAANSEHVRSRVQQYYHRDAKVIYPPIADELFNEPRYEQKRPGKHYLSFGALTPYKRIDLLVDAFNQSGEPLVVIGSGSELKKLRSRAHENITFLGSAPWSVVQEAIMDAKALLFPGVEDFGMIPLEVMSYGLPVLAYAKGGALETVIDHPEDTGTSTGCLFYEQTVPAVLEVIERFEAIERSFDRAFIFTHASGFREHEFKKQMLLMIRAMLEG